MKPLELWDWQKVDQDFLARHNWTALLAIETGGGKSLAAVEAIRNSGAERVLIVAPKQTHHSAWIPTVERQLGLTARVIGNGRKADREALADFEWGSPGIYLVTPQFLTRADVSRWEGDMLAVDEAHELSKAGGKGQRKLSGYSAKDGEPLAQRFVHRLALSGTPARNNFERLWATMRLLWPELGAPGQVANMSHWGWLKERMGSAQVFVGRDMWGAPKYATKWIGERSPGRLFNEAPAVIQHFRRHRCCEFHPNGFLTNEEPVVVVREVELTAQQKKAIREMEDHYMTWLGDNPLVADLTITQKQRIRQMCLGVPTVSEEGGVTFEPDCASPFYDELVNILESLDEGEPVVVFVESQKFARVVSDRLNGDGYSAFEYSGKTTSTRNEDLSRFGKDFQVAVVVISAGGTGLDGLQRVANTEVWLERSVDPTLNLQAEARLDRIGSTKGVQRFLIQDDLGYAEGRFSKQLDRMLKLRESTRKEVK